MGSAGTSARQAALAAAVAVARDHGLVVEDPSIVHDGSNLLVELRPAPVIARVAFAAARVRDGDGWLRREVAVAGFLADAGAPVVSPSDLLDPGPHHRDGFVVSFWRRIPATSAAPDGYGAGRALRACHDALAGWENAAALLLRWGGLEEARALVERLAARPLRHPGDASAPGDAPALAPADTFAPGDAPADAPAAAPADTSALGVPAPALAPGDAPAAGRAVTSALGVPAPALAPADAALLREVGARVQERVEGLGLPLQAIHGDAHLRNVLEAPDGPLWADWEDAFLGPRGWDLACLYAFLPPFGDADPARVGQAYRGYGEPLHVDLLRPLVAARRFQVVVWSVVLAGDDPARIERSRRWLDDLRGRRGAAAEPL
jgi:hypothetical protein